MKEYYRCPDCKHTFEEPEDENGNTPELTDKVKCPECGESWDVIYCIMNRVAYESKRISRLSK